LVLALDAVAADGKVRPVGKGEAAEDRAGADPGNHREFGQVTATRLGPAGQHARAERAMLAAAREHEHRLARIVRKRVADDRIAPRQRRSLPGIVEPQHIAFEIAVGGRGGRDRRRLCTAAEQQRGNEEKNVEFHGTVSGRPGDCCRILAIGAPAQARHQLPAFRP